MTDPLLRPRDFVMPPFTENFGAGPVNWTLPEAHLELPKEEQQRVVWLLAGAVAQHEHARAFTARVFGPGRGYRSLAHVARRWALRERWIRAVVRGDKLMLPADLAALLLVTRPEHAPDPPLLRARLVTALRTAGASGSKGLPPDLPAMPGLTTRAQVDAMIALGGEGHCTISTAPTAEESAGYAANTRLARPLVEQAAQTLRRLPDRLPPDRRHAGDDNEVTVEPRGGDHPPGARGGVNPAEHDEPGGVSVVLWLRHDWEPRVHDRGLAVVDGWFIADLAGPADDPRPTDAKVLDLLLIAGEPGWDDDGALGEYEYLVRDARLVWEADSTPRVVPADDAERRRATAPFR